MKNIFILAAENSAEKYGALLLERFKKSKKKYNFFGAGGDKFKDLGVDLIIHRRELSIVGIVEVMGHLFKLKKLMDLFVKKAKERRCDAAILIDYPDFNLRLAKKFRKIGVPVYYYISPTVWAWRYSRVKIIKKYINHLFIIFPFEREIFGKENIPFTYIGHPLTKLVKMSTGRSDFRKKYGVGKKSKMLAILPGSRESEISSLLPVMLKTCSELVKKQKVDLFVLKADSIDNERFLKYFRDLKLKIEIIPQNEGYDLIGSSDGILSTCGTSNLEAALLGVPVVAVYKVNRLSYLLGKGFLKISSYSIVNILLKEKVIDELIQNDFTVENTLSSVEKMLFDKERIFFMRDSFKKLKIILKSEQDPSEMIYKKITSDLS